MEKIEDLIVRYGIVAGRRFYKREKIRFLVAITDEFQRLGYHVGVKTTNKGQVKAYNLYIGDVRKAETIITTYYDTPAKTFGLISHKVLSKNGRTQSINLSTVLPMLISIVIGALFIVNVAEPIWSENIFQFESIIVGLITLILLRCVMCYRRGMGNRINFVRNTSSIIALLNYANELPKEDRHKVAFVLTDFGCVNHLGEEMVKSFLGESSKNKKFIMLDSIGSYNDLTLLSSAKLKNKAINACKTVTEQSNKVLNLDEPNGRQYKIYENNLIITSGSIKDGEVVVEQANTRKDSDINIENIYQTVKLLKNLI